MIIDKVASSKNEFIHTYFSIFFSNFSSLSKFVHEFLEVCFYKPKLLLAAKWPISLSIPPNSPSHSFLYTFVTVRFVKVIIISQ